MKHKSVLFMLLAAAACGFGQDKTTELNEQLVRAVAERNVQTARDCLGRGASPNSGDVHGQTALCLATRRGPVELVKLLLDRGADPNLPSRNDVENPRTDIEIRLPITGSPGNDVFVQKDSSYLYSEKEMASGTSALMIATASGAMDIASLLLQKGANPNYHGFLIAKTGAPAEETTALSLAAAAGMRALVELLLRNGAEAHGGDRGLGMLTPLMIAARDGNVEIAELLVGNKANVNAKERKSNWPALAFALKGGYGDVARLLLKHGADTRELDYLQIALEGGDAEALDLLLQKGADLRSGDYLRKAAERGSVPLVEVLLRHGAAVDGAGTAAATPLMIALRAGSYVLAALLVDHGANVNALDARDGSTPLVLAVRAAHAEITKMLLARGAAVDAGSTG